MIPIETMSFRKEKQLTCGTLEGIEQGHKQVILLHLLYSDLLLLIHGKTQP